MGLKKIRKWRREGDSNSIRLPVYSLSRRALSTTQAPLEALHYTGGGAICGSKTRQKCFGMSLAAMASCRGRPRKIMQPPARFRQAQASERLRLNTRVTGAPHPPRPIICLAVTINCAAACGNQLLTLGDFFIIFRQKMTDRSVGARKALFFVPIASSETSTRSPCR